MTPFKKALRSQEKAARHAFLNVGFKKRDKSESDYYYLMSEKSVKIYKQTVWRKGGWGSQLGRIS